MFFPSPKFTKSFLASVSVVHQGKIIMAHGTKWGKASVRRMDSAAYLQASAYGPAPHQPQVSLCITISLCPLFPKGHD